MITLDSSKTVEMSRLETLEDIILPTAVLAGVFGDDVQLVKCDTHEDSHGQDQYASVVMFSSLDIESKDKKETVRIVVKFNQESETFRRSVLTDIQMQNEVYMYERFFPFLKLEPIIPKFYYGIATGGRSPEQDVILLQDLCKDYYKTYKKGLDLDYGHVIVALQQLARFHAASYISKHKEVEVFFDKMEHLKEAQWRNDKQDKINMSLIPVIKKVTELLISKGRNIQILVEFLDKIKNPLEYIRELVMPEEPISVICHGDFCKDNILFKYDDKNTPIEAKFVDFGTVCYASPFIDLSFFLFFNTTSTLRRKYLDDFLTEYYTVLKLSCKDVQIPQIEMFELDFQSKAVYGFLNCCIQIPNALSEPNDWEELALLTDEQVENYYAERCNLQSISVLLDILSDLIYFKCKI